MTFKVFDLITIDDRPDDLGLDKSFHMAYAWHIYGENHIKPHDKSKAPTDEGVKFYLDKYDLINNQPEYFCIDIESWKLHSNYGKNPRIDQLENLINYFDTIFTVRKYLPNIKLGWYDLGAVSTGSWGLLKGIMTPDQYKDWQSENDKGKPLMAHMDFMNPSMYMYQSQTFDEWARKATGWVNEARRLNQNTPVYLQISPQAIKDDWPRFMSGELFYKILEWCRSYCEGCVIWTYRTKSKRTTWDENAEWWIELQRFLDKYYL